MKSSALFPGRILIDAMRLAAIPSELREFARGQLRAMLQQNQADPGVIFLTSPESHRAVREELARVQDELICLPDGAPLPALEGPLPRERVWEGRSTALALRLGARAVFSLAASTRPEVFAGLPRVVAAWGGEPMVTLEHATVQCVEPRLEAVLGAAAFLVLPVSAPPEPVPSGPSESLSNIHYPGDPAFEGEHELMLVAFRRALRLAQSAGLPGLTLHLADGEETRTAELRALARTLGIERFVRWHPGPPGRLRPDSDVLVLTGPLPVSLTQVLPALSAGLHVLTDLDVALQMACGGALQQVDRRRPDALGDALLAICTNPGLRRDLHRRSLDLFKSATFERAAHLLQTRLEQAAANPPRPFVAGFHADGWIEEDAVCGFSALQAVAELELELHASPAPRHLILRAGDRALGLYDLIPGQPLRIRLRQWMTAEPIWFRVPDAAPLAPQADPRRHGVQVAALRLHTDQGTAVELFRAP